MQQSLSFLLVGVFASAAVQWYVFGHATAEFVDVVFFVVLGALFTATTQTIVPRRDLTTLSRTQVASVLSSHCSGIPSSTVWPMRALSCCSSSRRTTQPLPLIHGSR